MVQASFDPAGQGRAQVGFTTTGGASDGFRQCWDASACLVYVLDHADYSCGSPPSSAADPASCPAVPLPPF